MLTDVKLLTKRERKILCHERSPYAGYVRFDVNIITDAIVVGGNSATSEAETGSRF